MGSPHHLGVVNPTVWKSETPDFRFSFQILSDPVFICVRRRRCATLTTRGRGGDTIDLAFPHTFTGVLCQGRCDVQALSPMMGPSF